MFKEEYICESAFPLAPLEAPKFDLYDIPQEKKPQSYWSSDLRMYVRKQINYSD